MNFSSINELFSYAKRDRYLINDEAWIEDREKCPVGVVMTHTDGSKWRKVAQGKWQKVSKGKYHKMAEKIQKENPVDKNYKHFVKNSNGDIEFGYITKEQAGKMNKRPATIRLSEGTTGLGLQHANRHLEQINKKAAQFGKHYDTLADFVEDIINNYDEIKAGGYRERTTKNGKKVQIPGYFLIRTKDYGTVTIEYEKSKFGKDFYTVNTASHRRHDSKLKNEKPLWS